MPISEVENIVPGTYFLYPTPSGRNIKFAMLYEADEENNMEIVSCESLRYANSSEKVE